MKSLFVKVLVIAPVLCLLIALSMPSYAQAESSKVVTAVLGSGSITKQVSIPPGYRPHIADLHLVGSGTDEFAVRVIVGKRQAVLSLPAHPSAILPLDMREDVSMVPVYVIAYTGHPFVVNVKIICEKASQL